LRWNHQTS